LLNFNTNPSKSGTPYNGSIICINSTTLLDNLFNYHLFYHTLEILLTDAML
jgi:hypothetical protein